MAEAGPKSKKRTKILDDVLTMIMRNMEADVMISSFILPPIDDGAPPEIQTRLTADTTCFTVTELKELENILSGLRTKLNTWISKVSARYAEELSRGCQRSSRDETNPIPPPSTN